jgi:hypothetical protein
LADDDEVEEEPELDDPGEPGPDEPELVPGVLADGSVGGSSTM